MCVLYDKLCSATSECAHHAIEAHPKGTYNTTSDAPAKLKVITTFNFKIKSEISFNSI